MCLLWFDLDSVLYDVILWANWFTKMNNLECVDICSVLSCWLHVYVLNSKFSHFYLWYQFRVWVLPLLGITPSPSLNWTRLRNSMLDSMLSPMPWIPLTLSSAKIKCFYQILTALWNIFLSFLNVSSSNGLRCWEWLKCFVFSLVSFNSIVFHFSMMISSSNLMWCRIIFSLWQCNWLGLVIFRVLEERFDRKTYIYQYLAISYF